jgi:hypothetical protein
MMQPAFCAANGAEPEIPHPVPFALPGLSVPLSFVVNAVGAQVAIKKAHHEEQFKVYNKAHSLERQLNNQLLKAVPLHFI